MLHRIKKKNDINQDKWIGIGGKAEPGEMLIECMKRECLEETGLHWHDPELRGIITFNSREFENGPLFSEQMFLYTGSDFSGSLKDCEEGVLEWVRIEDVFSLPLWEGDFLFLEKIRRPSSFFYMKLDYVAGHLVSSSVTEA